MSRPKAPDPLEPDAPPEEQHEAQGGERSRLSGPLESIFQEAVRRATALGLSGFFLTEEAVRKALTDTVPKEWVDYISRQSEDVRSDAIDRLVSEFGAWLRSLDLPAALRSVLEDYEISAKVEISAGRKRSDPAVSLQVARRRK